MTEQPMPPLVPASAVGSGGFCPRCTEPLAAFPGDSGSASRTATDRSVKICGDCGMDEAVRDASTLPPVPFDEWPVPLADRLTWNSLNC